jgi:hypothetical protein
MDASTSIEIEQLKAQRNVGGLTGTLSQAQDADLRRAAVQALGELGGTEAARALVLALCDADDEVRAAAGRALRTYKSKELSKTLQDMMSDPDPAASKAAVQGTLELLRQKSSTADNPPVPTSMSPRRLKVILFLVGAAAWFVVFVLAGILSAIAPSSGALLFAWLVLPLVLIVMATRGWNVTFVDRRGHTSIFETIYKGVIVFIIAITGIGMIWVCYWTGKTILRMWYRA